MLYFWLVGRMRRCKQASACAHAPCDTASSAATPMVKATDWPHKADQKFGHIEIWTAGNNSPRTGGSGCGLRASAPRIGGRPPTKIIPPLAVFSSSSVSSRVSLILVFAFIGVLHRDAAVRRNRLSL